MTKVFFAFLIASIIWDFWNWNSLDRWTIEHTFIMIATDLGYWCNLTVAPTKLCELRIHKYIQEKWGWISIDSMFTNGHWKSCNVFCWEEKQTTANVTQCIKLCGGYTAGLRLNEEQGHRGKAGVQALLLSPHYQTSKITKSFDSVFFLGKLARSRWHFWSEYKLDFEFGRIMSRVFFLVRFVRNSIFATVASLVINFTFHRELAMLGGFEAAFVS